MRSAMGISPQQVRPRRLLLKRRRGPNSLVERKVKALKGLVPNGCASVDLDGLFKETADYILNLQMKVRLMQIMVKLLSPVPHN